MANAVKLRETIAVIRENQNRWGQTSYADGVVNPNATTWQECDTSFCLGGWRCVLDGLRPRYYAMDFDDEDDPESFYAFDGFYDPADPQRKYITPYDHAMVSFGLTERQADFLFLCMTRDLAVLEDRVERVIAGEI